MLRASVNAYAVFIYRFEVMTHELIPKLRNKNIQIANSITY